MIEVLSSPSPLAVEPAWWYLTLVSAAALGVTWLLQRVAQVKAFASWRRWIPIVLVSVWATVAVVWLRRLLPDEGTHDFARAAALLVIAIAALPWLRNIFHALVFGIENRYRIGDDLRVGEVEGRLSSVGPRAIVLRASDGTEITIPHAELAKQHVVRLNLEVRDAPCELVLVAPANVEVELAAELARTAAALSPYAAPRCRPSVFVVTDGSPSGARLRLRGFVFDREVEALYRSDVGARFMRMLREGDLARLNPRHDRTEGGKA